MPTISEISFAVQDQAEKRVRVQWNTSDTSANPQQVNFGANTNYGDLQSGVRIGQDTFEAVFVATSDPVHFQVESGAATSADMEIDFEDADPSTGTTTESAIINGSKITSGQNSGQAGSVFSSRVDEYVEATTALSSGGVVRDIANIDDNTKSSTGTASGGVSITESGTDVAMDSPKPITIPNVGSRFSR